MAFIKIVSKREGFYRAGLRHSTIPHIYDEKELEGKLEALKAEPMLIVTEVPKKKLAEEKKNGAVLTFELEAEKSEDSLEETENHNEIEQAPEAGKRK